MHSPNTSEGSRSPFFTTEQIGTVKSRVKDEVAFAASLRPAFWNELPESAQIIVGHSKLCFYRTVFGEKIPAEALERAYLLREFGKSREVRSLMSTFFNAEIRERRALEPLQRSA